MSVDYSSVLIYGFKIPLTNENYAAMFRATGREFWELSDPDFGYFGVVIDDEIELDPTEVKGWIKNQEYEIPYAFNQFFGEEFYEQLGCPMLKLYNFVRPW